MRAIQEAMGRLSAIPFFPSNDGAVLEIMRQLENMIGAEIVYGSTPQQRLDWLVSAAINGMRTWGGIPELRGLLCWRWKPADGIESYSSLPGYSAGDSESLAYEEHQDRKAVETGRTPPKLLEAERDRMPAGEFAKLHRDTIGKLVETTRFPTRRRKALAAAERELAEAPRHYLTEEQKALRLAALQAGLKIGGNPMNTDSLTSTEDQPAPVDAAGRGGGAGARGGGQMPNGETQNAAGRPGERIGGEEVIRQPLYPGRGDQPRRPAPLRRRRINAADTPPRRTTRSPHRRNNVTSARSRGAERYRAGMRTFVEVGNALARFAIQRLYRGHGLLRPSMTIAEQRWNWTQDSRKSADSEPRKVRREGGMTPMECHSCQERSGPAQHGARPPESNVDSSRHVSSSPRTTGGGKSALAVDQVAPGGEVDAPRQGRKSDGQHPERFDAVQRTRTIEATDWKLPQ